MDTPHLPRVNEATILRGVTVAVPQSGIVEQRELSLSCTDRSAGRCTLDLKDHAVLPALVNAHDHLHLNGVPPLAVTGPFRNSYDWASAYRDHFERPEVRCELAVPKELRHWQGALKNALCGATTVMHHDPAHPVFDAAGFPVRVLQPYGWAHSLHWPYGPPVRHSFETTPSGVPWFIHLGEGTDATAGVELDELQALGCLRANTVLIHGVGIDDQGVRDIIAQGAALVWCPSSNLAILGQTITAARIRTLAAAGRLALGTDSRLSGERDLLAELRIAAEVSDLSARELLQLAGERARLLLRADPAHNDFVIFRRISADPFEDLLRLQRHQLRAVVRDGDPLIADPDLERWFVHRGIAFEQILLDGERKLCARSLISPTGIPDFSLEPGLATAESL